MSLSKSFYKSDYLYHHGILGQRWGKRNGPPYPLDGEDHSASEKKAGWRKSLDRRQKKDYNRDVSTGNKKALKKKRGLTDKQKRAIKIGAAVAVTALAAYGTYRLAKSGKLDKFAEMGKNKVDELLGKKQTAAGDLPSFDKSNVKSFAGEAAKAATTASQSVGGIKRLAHAETLSDTLRRTNPHLGDTHYTNNCSLCGIAAVLRRRGFDVSAKDTGGIQQNLGGLVEECFKGAKVFDGSAVKFGRSQKDAAEMLVRRFGENAEGVCSVQWRGNFGGHTFNWIIKNGVVTFFDAQQQTTNVAHYWNRIDLQGALQLARLDNIEIDFEAIKKYVE